MNTLRTLFIILFCGCLVPAVMAQSDMFTKVFMQDAGSVQTYGMLKTPANNYLLAGFSNNKPMAMMISETGSVLWCKTYDTAYGNFYCGANTADGNILLAGALGYQQGGYMNDVLLVKITTSGDTLWSKKLDMGYEETPFSLKPTSDGGFILSGFSYDNSPPYYRSFVVKLDASGNVQWGKTFYYGNFDNYAFSATETPDGGFWVSGSVAGASNSDRSLLIAKFNSSGSVLWAEKFPDSLYLRSVAYDAVITNGNAICYFIDQTGSTSLMKVDMSGNVIWCKNMGSQGSYQYMKPAPKLHQCSDGGFTFVNGSESFFGPLGALMKADSTGEVVWERDLLLLTIDESPTSNDGFLVCGNGPIIGVGKSSYDSPQIGTIKLNTQGSTYGCINGGTATAVPFSPVLLPVTLNTSSAGSMSITHCVLQNIVMVMDSGCILVTGGVAEKRGLEPLRIVPNPSGGKIRLETGINAEASFSSLEVFNSLGENVYLLKTSGSAIKNADLGFLPDGLFMLKAVSAGKTYAGKLLIAH